MTKELLQVEFRYNTPRDEKGISRYNTKTITIGIYNTLGEAAGAGNAVLDILSETFEVRGKFKQKGLLGYPDRLITNTCYPTNRVQYFASITKLNYNDLEESVSEIMDTCIKK